MEPTPRIEPLGWLIIIVVVVLTLGVAAVAFMTSYGALYAWVRDADLYSDQLDHAWPLLLDAAFIAAELAAILAAMLRGRPSGWPLTVMVITGMLTLFFNVAHAGTHWSDWPKWLAAALPPALMMLCFQIDLAIVLWVRRALGKPLEEGLLRGMHLGVPQMDPRMQAPSVTRSRMGQYGQWGSEVGGGEVNKRAAIQTAAAELGTEEVTAIGPEGVTAYLAEHYGVQTTPGYVRKVLDGRAAPRNGQDRP